MLILVIEAMPFWLINPLRDFDGQSIIYRERSLACPLSWKRRRKKTTLAGGFFAYKYMVYRNILMFTWLTFTDQPLWPPIG